MTETFPGHSRRDHVLSEIGAFNERQVRAGRVFLTLHDRRCDIVEFLDNRFDWNSKLTSDPKTTVTEHHHYNAWHRSSLGELE